MWTNSRNNEPMKSSIDALRSQDIPAGPSEKLMASTAAAMHAVAVSDTTIPKSQAVMFRAWGARMIRSRILGYAVALVILACAISAVFVFNGEAQRSFAEVIENVRKSTFTKYVYSTEYSNSGKAGYSICSVSDSAVRTEVYSSGKQHRMTYIVDLEKKMTLCLNVIDSRACLYPVKRELPANFGNPLGMMADITNEDATLVDTIWTKGKAVDIYKLSRVLPSSMGFQYDPSAEGSFKVWVDREAQLPIQMLFHYKPLETSKNTAELKIEIRDLQWNVQIEHGIFDLKIPNGFEVCKEFKDLFAYRGEATVWEEHTHPPHEELDKHPHGHDYQHKHEHEHVEGQEE